MGIRTVLENANTSIRGRLFAHLEKLYPLAKQDPFSERTLKYRNKVIVFSSILWLNSTSPIDLQQSTILHLKFEPGSSPPDPQWILTGIVLYQLLHFFYLAAIDISSWTEKARAVSNDSFSRGLELLQSHASGWSSSHKELNQLIENLPAKFDAIITEAVNDIPQNIMTESDQGREAIGVLKGLARSGERHYSQIGDAISQASLSSETLIEATSKLRNELFTHYKRELFWANLLQLVLHHAISFYAPFIFSIYSIILTI